MLCDDREGWDRLGVRGRFKRKGTYVYLQTTHVLVWQKPTQHYKAIVSNLKKKFFFKKDSMEKCTGGGVGRVPSRKKALGLCEASYREDQKPRGFSGAQTFLSPGSTFLLWDAGRMVIPYL